MTSGSDRTADIVRERFPGVEVVELPRAAVPGEARNAGLARARGDYVTFLGSQLSPPQGSLAARVRAHDRGHPVVTGTTLNGTPTWAGWATYFLDHAALLPGRPSGEVDDPPPHCSYVREALVAIGGFAEDEDTAAILELTRRGYRAYHAQDFRIVHHSRCDTARRLVRHQFRRGRATALIELDRAPAGRLLPRSSRRAFGLGYVWRRVATTTRTSVAGATASGSATPGAFRWSRPEPRRRGWASGSRPCARRAGAASGSPSSASPRRRHHSGRRPGARARGRRPRRAVSAPSAPSVARARARGHPPGDAAGADTRGGASPSAALPERRDRRGHGQCRQDDDEGPARRDARRGRSDRPDPAQRERPVGRAGLAPAVRPSDRFAVIELGIKGGPGEMRWMAGLFRPRVAVLTGIGTFHSEMFGSAAAIAREKRALLERLGRQGTAVVNADDPFAREAAEGCPAACCWPAGPPTRTSASCRCGAPGRTGSTSSSPSTGAGCARGSASTGDTSRRSSRWRSPRPTQPASPPLRRSTPPGRSRRASGDSRRRRGRGDRC